ncbi:MAG TPA: acyltransferase [Pirellulales bacterium]
MQANHARTLVRQADSPGCGAGRFQFVDALRGLAALSVAAYHISRYGPLAHAAEHSIPDFVQLLLKHGWIGVQIFFVISGFVIAYSLRRAAVTPRFIGQFALRRSLRLDPSYWTTIVLVLVLSSLLPASFAEPASADPLSAGQLVAHVGYLQNVLGYENLSVGFWTLCIEVQFYLMFVVLLGVAQWTAGGAAGADRACYQRLLALLAPVAIASLFYFGRQRASDAWLVHFFSMFFLGMLVCWSLEGKISRLWFGLFAALMAASLTVHWSLDITVALLTGLSVYLVGRAGHLHDWLGWRPLQYLGRISYSLYLIHYPTSCLVTALGRELTGDAPLPAAAWLAVSLVASIGAAHLLYVLVERPSLEFSRRIGAPDWSWQPLRRALLPAAIARAWQRPAGRVAAEE